MQVKPRPLETLFSGQSRQRHWGPEDSSSREASMLTTWLRPHFACWREGLEGRWVEPVGWLIEC